MSRKNHTQRRAAKGGEMGVNGEWYEGGKFIANTERPKRHGSDRPTGRQEVAPFQWEQPPFDGARSIYAQWGQLWGRNPNGSYCRHPSASAAYFGADTLDEAARWAERYNNGERWCDTKTPR